MEISKALIETFMGNIQELEQRVRILERANPLVGSLPRGTTITVLDPDDGSVITQIGGLDDGRTGIELKTPTGVTVLRADDRGVLAPLLYVPLEPWSTDFSQAIAANGAGWSSVWLATLSQVQHRYLRLTVQVSGGTGSLRVTMSDGQVTSTKAISGSTQASLYLEMEALNGTNDLTLFLQVNNPAGADINVRMPQLVLGDFADVASTAGVWL